jgi:uncharacterized protein with PIN domain
VNAYAESSAVLAWLLRENQAESVSHALASADAVVSSVLTLVEVDRALVRAVASGRMSEAGAAVARGRFELVATRWAVLSITDEQIDRARRPFPRDPVRSLDAIHLSAALEFVADLSELTMVSLDERVRENATLLGFPILPPTVT